MEEVAGSAKNVKKDVIESHNKEIFCIKITMTKQNDKGKFKIICFKAPKWLGFLLRKLCKNKGWKVVFFQQNTT